MSKQSFPNFHRSNERPSSVGDLEFWKAEVPGHSSTQPGHLGSFLSGVGLHSRVVRDYLINKDVPWWFRGNSPTQMQAAESLQNALRDDFEQGTTHRILRTLRTMGLRPLPSLKDIRLLMKVSRCNDLAFLYFLMENNYKKHDDGHQPKTSYNLNEQVIMSSIYHLDAITTLRGLDRLLPKGHASIREEFFKQRDQNKKQNDANLIEEERQAKEWEARYGRKYKTSNLPYFQRQRRPKPYGLPLFTKPPKFTISLGAYEKYSDPHYEVANESNRWYENYEVHPGRRVAYRILNDQIQNMMENFNRLSVEAHTVASLCQTHRDVLNLEKSLEKELAAIARDDCCKYFDIESKELYATQARIKKQLERDAETYLCRFKKEAEIERRKYMSSILEQESEGSLDLNKCVVSSTSSETPSVIKSENKQEEEKAETAEKVTKRSFIRSSKSRKRNSRGQGGKELHALEAMSYGLKQFKPIGKKKPEKVNETTVLINMGDRLKAGADNKSKKGKSPKTKTNKTNKNEKPSKKGGGSHVSMQLLPAYSDDEDSLSDVGDMPIIQLNQTKNVNPNEDQSDKKATSTRISKIPSRGSRRSTNTSLKSKRSTLTHESRLSKTESRHSSKGSRRTIRQSSRQTMQTTKVETKKLKPVPPCIPKDKWPGCFALEKLEKKRLRKEQKRTELQQRVAVRLEKEEAKRIELAKAAEAKKKEELDMKRQSKRMSQKENKKDKKKLKSVKAEPKSDVEQKNKAEKKRKSKTPERLSVAGKKAKKGARKSRKSKDLALGEASPSKVNELEKPTEIKEERKKEEKVKEEQEIPKLDIKKLTNEQLEQIILSDCECGEESRCAYGIDANLNIKDTIPPVPTKEVPYQTAAFYAKYVCCEYGPQDLPTPTPSNQFFNMPAEHQPYRFNYRKIFKFKQNDKQTLDIKRELLKALDADVATLNELYEQGPPDIAAQALKCAESMWQQGAQEKKKEMEAVVPKPPKNPLGFDDEHDCENTKKMMQMLKVALAKLAENPKYVLAGFPFSYKLPMLREWIMRRYGKTYSRAERYESFKTSKEVFIHAQQLSKNVALPKMELLGKNMRVDYSCRKYLVQKSNRIIAEYHDRVKELLMYKTRIYWFAARAYLCPLNTPRKTFFAYMPSNIDDIHLYRLWKLSDGRNMRDIRQQAKLRKEDLKG